jgi:demethylmenaquinone methyltransferase/2-methoxy-6-polyprenyl-1,4-benzoquinol methylase
MTLDKQQTRDLYRQQARHFDRAIWIYRLVGLREKKYRRETVKALSLKPGDTVVDLGCGTGLNFPWLEKAVQEQG